MKLLPFHWTRDCKSKSHWHNTFERLTCVLSSSSVCVCVIIICSHGCCWTHHCHWLWDKSISVYNHGKHIIRCAGRARTWWFSDAGCHDVFLIMSCSCCCPPQIMSVVCFLYLNEINTHYQSNDDISQPHQESLWLSVFLFWTNRTVCGSRRCLCHDIHVFYLPPLVTFQHCSQRSLHAASVARYLLLIAGRFHTFLLFLHTPANLSSVLPTQYILQFADKIDPYGNVTQRFSHEQFAHRALCSWWQK